MATPPLALRPAKRRPASHQQTTPCALFDYAPVIRATRPDTPHVRAPRILDLAGELITATILIAGGVFAYGFMPSV
jgi:hypothetical protein